MGAKNLCSDTLRTNTPQNYREVHPSVIKHPTQFDTPPGERAHARTLAAARVTGRRAPPSPLAAVRRCSTTGRQSTSLRSVLNVLRGCLSGDPRRRSAPDNALATPSARARVAGGARGAAEGGAKQTSTSRSGEVGLLNISFQSILIRAIAGAAAADRPAIGEERD